MIEQADWDKVKIADIDWDKIEINDGGIEDGAVERAGENNMKITSGTIQGR